MKNYIFFFLFLFTIFSINAQENRDSEKSIADYQKQLEEQQIQINKLNEQMLQMQKQLSFIATEETKDKDDTFKPHGKVFARIFMGYSHNLQRKSDRRQGFDIARSYLGYDYYLSKNWSSRVMIDGTPDGTLAQTGKDDVVNFKNPAMKNVYLKYETDKFTITGGMVTTPHVVIPLQYWENRYVLKNFSSENKLAKGADIGLIGSYKINPILSIDAAILKGEGYRKISKNNMYQYVIGAIINPTKHIVFRPLFDIKTGENEHKKDRMYAAGFLGYKDSNLRIGTEFAKVFNDGTNKYGYSLFANGKIAPKMKIFGRFDVYSTDLSSSNYSGYNFYNENNSWFAGHTNMFLFGWEYEPVKGVKIAPNFIHKLYKKADIDGKNMHSNTLAVSVEVRI